MILWTGAEQVGWDEMGRDLSETEWVGAYCCLLKLAGCWPSCFPL